MEDHQHKFKEIVIKPITRIDNPNYSGTTGDKSFLFRRCECGHFKTFEYGATKLMKKLQAELV